MGKGALGQLAAYWPEDTARYAHVPLKRVTEITVHAQAAAAEARPALMTGGGPVSYGELSGRVKKVAAVLRARLSRGARVAIGLADPADLLAVLFGAFESEMLSFATAGEAPAELLSAFGADLVIDPAEFRRLLAVEGNEKAERPDFKRALLALPKPDRSGEVQHNHKTLAATAISVGSFFMIEPETAVLLEEPPTDWLGLAMVLGTWQRGGTIWVGWGPEPAKMPERVEYLVSSWAGAIARHVDPPPRIPRLKVGVGAIVGVEDVFSVSRRRRLARRLHAPVLTMLGRNDLGPVIASHPTWYLDDAVGIPLPNVDTRPINPATGTPLNIGWDAVETAEIGFKSALAPAGGEMVDEGWLRSRLLAEIDPTGLYFLCGPGAR